MITRRKGIIIVAGKMKEEVLTILRYHQALVQIKQKSEIPKIWKNNKTPIVDEQDFLKVCSQYEGAIFVFNTDEQGITNIIQEEISEKFTRFCYNVKIEPGEFNQVGRIAYDALGDCIFCDIAKHSGMTTYTYNIRCKLVDMIIYESKNFFVVPGLGPLTSGYLMIMTKKHYLSLAQLPKTLMQEYKEVEEDVEKILSSLYHKKVCFYEHGTGPNETMRPKSIVHMHIHAMLDNELTEEYLEMFSMRNIIDITESKANSYFWYKCGTNGEQWIVDNLGEVYVQRQAARQIYAEKHNFAKGQFNWRKTPFESLTKTNVWQLYNFLAEVENSIIKERTKDFVMAAKVRFEEK